MVKKVNETLPCCAVRSLHAVTAVVIIVIHKGAYGCVGIRPIPYPLSQAISDSLVGRCHSGGSEQ